MNFAIIEEIPISNILKIYLKGLNRRIAFQFSPPGSMNPTIYNGEIVT